MTVCCCLCYAFSVQKTAKTPRHPSRREPIRFTRGRRFYQIALAYAEGETGWIGLCDGRVVVRAPERAEVARALISGPSVPDQPGVR